jgi:hypothetical protein
MGSVGASMSDVRLVANDVLGPGAGIATEILLGLTFSHKHEVASMFAEYLVRTKNYLDAQNPLFKERAREAETLVKATTATVNVTAPAATAMKNRRKKAEEPAAAEADASD